MSGKASRGSSLPAIGISAVGFWSSALPDWTVARAVFRGEGEPVEGGARRPSPALLPPAERRRVPDSVAAALEAASQALAASGLDAADVPSVFTSAYGDLAGTDALCASLAEPVPMLSPTRFHNDVHNAAAGYWCIATGCRQASSAVSAHVRSFAAGLLEAATLCVADDTPVLLVGFDGAPTGPLVDVVASRGLLAVAMVLLPPSALPGRAMAELHLAIEPDDTTGTGGSGDTGSSSRAPAGSADDAARTLEDNAMADALPLCEALAAGARAAWRQALSDHACLALRLEPVSSDASLASRASAPTPP